MIEKIKNFIKRFSITRRIGYYILNKIDEVHKDIIKRINQLDYKLEYLFWFSQRKDGESATETRSRVMKQMPKAENEARILQLANNGILKKLKVICDENEIQFALVFGSLLGAVRHEGYVPWDDDVDIAMLRSDFEKLREVLAGNDELRLDIYFNANYFRFAKVKFSESETFFVDVFILDCFEAGENSIEERYNELKTENLNYVDAVREQYRKHGIEISQLALPQRNAVIEKELEQFFDTECRKLAYYGEGEYICFGIDNPTFIRNMGYVYKKSDMFPLTEVCFEGEKYHTFKNCDAWLKNAYGDYWSLPRNIMTGHSDFTHSSIDYEVLLKHGITDENLKSDARTFEGLDIHF